MTTVKNQKPHAIMVALHLQGHIVPLVNLAIKLASKGFSITFAHTEHIHHQISKSQNNSADFDPFTQARKSGLDIQYTTLSDGLPIDFDRTANFVQFLDSFAGKLPEHVDDLVGKILKSHSSSGLSHFLIADTFSLWPAKIAEKYGLVNVSLWTQPALVFNLYYHLELLRENGHVPANNRDEDVICVPGIESINTKDFVSYFRDSELGPLHKILYRAFDLVKSADFILCNTVQEFEADSISALQKYQPFYAIGPLFPSNFTKSSVPGNLLRESECTKWLSSKPPGSVMYVSFGSLATTEKHVIQEVARGFLLSDMNFLWVLRPGIVESDSDGILPDGFEDSIKDRGLIVPWCTQNQVLSNPAIGGFLTHCGWNSILESIWCGVPMLCYPLFTDQLTNRKLVVDDWKIGINLCDGPSITREEVAEKIRNLMDGKRAKELRQEVQKVREILHNAIAKDGSSEKNFECFIDDVLAEIQKKIRPDVI